MDDEYLNELYKFQFNYDNINEFHDLVRASLSKVSEHLVTMVKDEFHLLDHLQALKSYLLLGQGDFIEILIEKLSSELSKERRQIYLHNLSSILESSIRSSNAQYAKTEITNRLQVKVLDKGTSGWEIFTLDYEIPKTLSAIISPLSMRNYLFIFHFLFNITHCECLLNELWSQLGIISKELKYTEEEPLLNYYISQCFIERSEMYSVLKNILDYIMVEVVETAWEELKNTVKNGKDMDELVKSHHNFIKFIKENGFMNEKNSEIFNNIISLLDVIVQFCTTQESNLMNIYDRSSKKRSYNEENERRAQEGLGWAADSASLYNFETEIQNFTAKGLNQLYQSQNEFRNTFLTLRKLLEDTNNYNTLLFRMDYNEFYSNQLQNI